MHPTNIRTNQRETIGGLSGLPTVRLCILLVVFIYSLLVVGCGTVPTRNPIPEELGNEAIIPGIPKPWNHHPGQTLGSPCPRKRLKPPNPVYTGKNIVIWLFQEAAPMARLPLGFSLGGPSPEVVRSFRWLRVSAQAP